MPGQLNNATKEARSRAAIAVAEEMRKQYETAMSGSVHDVLFEEAEGEYYTGHTPNYLKVYVKASDLHNRILPVQLETPYKDGMLGKLL